MAKLSTSEIIDAIKEMTILEVKDLVDAMKEEFGVDPSAVAVAAAPVAGADADADAKKTVVLKDAGASKIAVINMDLSSKIVNNILGFSLLLGFLIS